MRSSWTDVWLNVADEIAKRSLCARDQVGAVIVSATNRIVATGYNGPPAGFQHNNLPCTAWCPRSTATDLLQDYSDCPALHAEANALSVCDRQVREGGTIYVTSAICFGCAKLIANSGLSFVVATIQPTASHRNPQASYDLLRKCGLDVRMVHEQHSRHA